MKPLASAVGYFISPSIRFEIREAAAWLRRLIDRSCLWRWEIVRLKCPNGNHCNIIYIGRKSYRYIAKILLGVKSSVDATQTCSNQSSQSVVISELPFPGALCMPIYLRTIVSLAEPIEVLMANYDEKLRRSLLKNRVRYFYRQAIGKADIDKANREMIQTFARARHGKSAYIMQDEMVQRYALELGRLDLLLEGDEVVGCMLGIKAVRKGKQYWVADRCGYPASVFSDPKRLSEINSINHHLTIEWAIQNGFDYCDFARGYARPDDGLLQFKKNRGAALDTICLRSDGCLYLRLPKVGVSQFLWNNPIFAIEGDKLAMHIGLPVGKRDDEISTRYRKMGFKGLFKIYLHCANQPSELLLEKLLGFYANHDSPPIFKIIATA